MSQPVEPIWRKVGNLDDFSRSVEEAAQRSSTPSVRVEAVTVEWRTDLADDPVFLVALSLSDPPDGAETWPIDDLYKIRQKIRQEAAAAGVPAELTFSMKGSEELDQTEEPERALAERLSDAASES